MQRARVILLLLVSLMPFLPQAVSAQASREFKDIVYATVDGKPLALDLYMPAGVKSPALLVWVHGGAHGGDVFFAGEALERAVAFLHRTLGP